MDPVSSLICETQIGLWRAMITGVPDGACVAFGTGAIFVALGLFGGGVTVLQWIARRLVAQTRNAAPPLSVDGPIRSARRPQQMDGPINSR